MCSCPLLYLHVLILGKISTGGASNVADAVEYLSQKQAGWGVPLTMGIPGPRDSLTAADRATAIAELHKREDAVNAAIKQAKKDQMTAYRETQKKNAEQRKQAVLTEFEEISSREKALKSGEAAQLREQFMINKADAEAKKLQDIDNERRLIFVFCVGAICDMDSINQHWSFSVQIETTTVIIIRILWSTY